MQGERNINSIGKNKRSGHHDTIDYYSYFATICWTTLGVQKGK